MERLGKVDSVGKTAVGEELWAELWLESKHCVCLLSVPQRLSLVETRCGS